MKYLKLFENYNKGGYNITEVILELIEEFKNEWGCPTPYDINNGSCVEFAEDVINRMGGYTDSLYEIDSSSIFTTDVEDWDDYYNVIETDGGCCGWSKISLDKYGHPPVDITKIYNISDHVWIYYNGKHYDAENIKGVNNWYELSIYKKLFGI